MRSLEERMKYLTALIAVKITLEWLEKDYSPLAPKLQEALEYLVHEILQRQVGAQLRGGLMAQAVLYVDIACLNCNSCPGTGNTVHVFVATDKEGKPFLAYLCDDCRGDEKWAHEVGEVLDQSPSPPPTFEALFIE